MWVAFANAKATHICKSYSHFFSKNISIFAIFYDQSFNDSLTNDIVSFEQLGPEEKWLQSFLSPISHNPVDAAEALVLQHQCVGTDMYLYGWHKIKLCLLSNRLMNSDCMIRFPFEEQRTCAVKNKWEEPKVRELEQHHHSAIIFKSILL